MDISNQVKFLRISVYLLIILILSSCQKEKVKKEYKPYNGHEAYIYSLKQANLQKTTLFKQFVESSELALSNALKIPIPYSEMFYFNHAKPTATGYRISLRRGQKLKLKADLLNEDSVLLFVDIFRIRDTTNTSWYKVASADRDTLYAEFVARRDAEYIVRIQSELLCDVRCKIRIEIESSLGFPVLGKDKSTIQSFFGDPRDGGKRRHHGVDVFAARHTDIIASADGYVGNTGSSRIGGRHIWVYYPSLGVNCYYAHLESINTERGKKIKAGTKIGTVGNTGNAKYTPPHLHFGIYQSGIGPVDPYHFIATENIQAKEISKSINFLGKSVRTKNNNVKINVRDSLLSLPINTDLFVEAVNSNKLRVKLSDGLKGFIKISHVELTTEGLSFSCCKNMAKLYNNPNELVIKKLNSIEKFQILSYHKDYCKVRLNNGDVGWMQFKDLI